jgi:preprotein translocase subunit SecE
VAFEAKANSGNKPRWVRYVNPANWVKGIVRFFINSGHFIRDSYREAKRITWPAREKVIKSTVVVIVSVVFITGFIWLADSGFRLALEGFLKLLK